MRRANGRAGGAPRHALLAENPNLEAWGKPSLWVITKDLWYYVPDMRERWTRTTAKLQLDAEAVARLMEPAFPGATVTEVARAKGGLMNTNLQVHLSNRAQPVLLRLYQRDAAQARIEVAATRRVAGQIPVPSLIHYSDDNPITGGAYAIMEWIEGERLEIVAPTLGRDDFAQLGRFLGQTLGAIHGFQFDRTGFLDEELDVAEPADVGHSGLIAYLEHCLMAGRGGARLGEELTSELLAFAERRSDLLDTWPGAPCLVHSDFNGSNILVHQRPSDGDWEVAAVLDWEFAFSGSPAFDFGNLLRPLLGDVEVFAEATAEGYRQSGRELPTNWRRIARVAGLFAWAEFLDRPNLDAAWIDDARKIIGSTIAEPDARDWG